MFYYLPNKRPVDVEGAIDGMLDENKANRYFLDTKTGDIGCVDTGNRGNDQKLESITRERSRYRELPRVSEEKKKEWLTWFVENVMSFDQADAPLQSKLREALRVGGFQKALAVLESSTEDSGYSWDICAGDRAFEDLGVWLKKEVPGFTYELKGCEDCAICRADANGAGLHDLLDAFEEQRQNDEDDPPQK